MASVYEPTGIKVLTAQRGRWCRLYRKALCQHISVTCHCYSSHGADNLPRVAECVTLIVMSNNASSPSSCHSTLPSKSLIFMSLLLTFVALKLYFRSRISIYGRVHISVSQRRGVIREKTIIHPHPKRLITPGSPSIVYLNVYPHTDPFTVCKQ